MEYKILVTTYDKDKLTKIGAGWLHYSRDKDAEETILVDISKELNVVAKDGWRVKQYNTTFGWDKVIFTIMFEKENAQ